MKQAGRVHGALTQRWMLYFQQINHVYYLKFILRRVKHNAGHGSERFDPSSFLFFFIFPLLSLFVHEFYILSLLVVYAVILKRRACKSFSCTMTFRTLERLFVQRRKKCCVRWLYSSCSPRLAKDDC